MKNCMLIENPNSGARNHDLYRNRIIKKLEEYFAEIEYKKTTKVNDGEKFAIEACKQKYDSIFVLGGDGTFNEVINGVCKMAYRPKIGLLPGGTNNTYMHLIGGSNTLDDAIDFLSFEKTKKVDIGKCNDKYFSYYVCFGKLIEATTSTTSEEKGKLGGFAYVKNILKTIPKDEVVNVELNTDGKLIKTKASLVYVMTTNRVGQIEFSNNDSPLNDGKLSVFIMTDEKILSKIEAVKDMIFGKLDDNENIKSFTCKKLTIKELDGNEIELDMDGEVKAKLPCKVEILQRYIEIYLPKNI